MLCHRERGREADGELFTQTNKHKIGERVKEIQNPQTNIKNKNIKQNKPEYLRNGRENSNKQAATKAQRIQAGAAKRQF